MSSSDIWAIGCTLFFMVAGYPAFAAINDYQSFRKIEALDYTFPEDFYETARDLVQRLVVRCYAMADVSAYQLFGRYWTRPTASESSPNRPLRNCVDIHFSPVPARRLSHMTPMP